MKFFLIIVSVFLIFLNPAEACKFSPYNGNIQDYVEELLDDENLLFVGRVKVSNRAEIGKFVFYEFEIVNQYFGSPTPIFVGYTANDTSCDVLNGFKKESEIFMKISRNPDSRDTLYSPLYISLDNTQFGGFSDEKIEEQLQKKIKAIK